MWPPASVPWATMMSTPASTCLRACRACRRAPATLTPCACACSTTSARRRAERVGEQRDRVLERDLDLRARGRRRSSRAAPCRRRLARGQRRARRARPAALHELAVLRRDHALAACSTLVGVAGRALVLGGHDDIDAVGLAVDVLVDPVELDLELLGREGERAEHAHAAGAAHRRDDVAAVAEREDRELDAEGVADFGVHRWSPGDSFWLLVIDLLVAARQAEVCSLT